MIDEMDDNLSVYLHIPFCRHRCAYCDFNTYTGMDDLQAAYVEGLSAEIRQVAAPRPASTIFFGGGTPSLLPAASIRALIDAVGEAFALQPDAEITLEANPETVDAQYLEELREQGVNRLSYGMQSAVAAELSLLERGHSLQTVVEAVELSRRAGFDNISVDLIYGLPGQSLASWQQSLEAALALETEHLSLYCLTIEPGTPMQRWLQNGAISAPDPDLAADQYELACTVLAAAGWEHYEISNWARPGRACRHNLTYWRDGHYLGLGAGAHGHAGGYRYHVVRQPRDYLNRLRQGQAGEFPLSAAVAEAHAISQDEAMSDAFITRLRLLEEGLDMEAFQETFGRPVHEAYGSTLARLMEWGLLEQQGKRLLLTRRGWFLSNQVFYHFV